MAFKRDIIAAGIITTTYPSGKTERRVQASSVPNAQMCFWGHPNETIIFKMFDLPQPVRAKREAVDLMLDMPQFDRNDKAWLKQVSAGAIPMTAARGSGKSRQHIPAFRAAAPPAAPPGVVEAAKKPPAKSVKKKAPKKRAEVPLSEAEAQKQADKLAAEAREKFFASQRALTKGTRAGPSPKRSGRKAA